MMPPKSAFLLLQFPDGTIGWIRGEVHAFTLTTRGYGPTELTVEALVYDGIQYGPPPAPDEAFRDREQLGKPVREIPAPTLPRLPGSRDG